METSPDAYKKVTITLTGDSQSGKTTFIKAMGCISAMRQMGVPKEQQYMFFSNQPFIAYGNGIEGFDPAFTFEQLGFRSNGVLNVPRAEDFINHPKVQPYLKENAALAPLVVKEKKGQLRFRDDGIDLSSAETYETVIGALKTLTESSVTLKDYVTQTRSTRAHTLKQKLETGKTLTYLEHVWVNIGNEYALVTIKDAPGQDSFKDIRPELYRDIHAGIILFSMNDMPSLHNVGKTTNVISFPTYENLDQTNLALVLKFLYTNHKQDYDALTKSLRSKPKLPKRFKETPYVFFKELSTKDDGANIMKLITQEFPKDLYDSIYQKHQKSGLPSWLQEMYNSRWLLKESDDQTVMVPVLVFGNKADLPSDVLERDMHSILTNGIDLPYITGSAIKLQNVENAFQATALMGLRLDGQIGPDEYHAGMSDVQRNLVGDCRLGEWTQPSGSH